MANPFPLTLNEKIVLRIFLALGFVLVISGPIEAMRANEYINLETGEVIATEHPYLVVGVLITILGVEMAIVGYSIAQGKIRLQRSERPKANS